MVTATNLIFFLSDNHTRDLLGAAGHLLHTPHPEIAYDLRDLEQRQPEKGVRFDRAIQMT